MRGDRGDALSPSAAAGSLADVNVEMASNLGADRDAWDALVLLAPVPSPFLRSWWLELAAGAQPLFLLVRRGGRLIGGLALEEHSVLGVNRLRMLGQGPLGPDHLDLLAERGQEMAVLGAIRSWVQRPGARRFDFVGVVEGSLLARALDATTMGETVAEAPWASLAADFETYLARRPLQLQQILRRRTRQLKEAGGMCQRVALRHADKGLSDLKNLHREQFGPKSNFLPAFDRFTRLALEGMQREELALYQLTVDGEVVALQATLEVAGRLSCYQLGRSPSADRRSVGTLLAAYVIAQACERGFHEVDFLRGAEPYKALWTDRQRGVVRLQGTRGAWARSLTGADRLLGSTGGGRRARNLALRFVQRQGKA